MNENFNQTVVQYYLPLMTTLGFKYAGDFTKRPGEDRIVFTSPKARACFMTSERNHEANCYFASPLAGPDDEITTGAWFPYGALLTPIFKTMSEEELSARGRRAWKSPTEWLLMMRGEIEEHFEVIIHELQHIDDDEQLYGFWK